MEHLTMSQRRERGETIVNRKGVELVHGRVLAREALADYQALVDESDRHWRSSSPFRTDHAEIQAQIDADALAQASELAYAIQQWLDDEAWEAEVRAGDIDRAAWSA